MFYVQQIKQINLLVILLFVVASWSDAVVAATIRSGKIKGGIWEGEIERRVTEEGGIGKGE